MTRVWTDVKDMAGEPTDSYWGVSTVTGSSLADHRTDTIARGMSNGTAVAPTRPAATPGAPEPGTPRRRRHQAMMSLIRRARACDAKELARITVILARNLVLGGSLSALTLAGKPRDMATYIAECLFLYKSIAQKRGVPQKNVFQVLPSPEIESITLGDLRGAPWFFRIPSYGADIVNLCLLARLIKPRVVFEIGTYEGYTSLHFALNTPDSTQVYTLDLPPNTDEAPTLSTTLRDDAHVQQSQRLRRHVFDDNDVASKITCLYGDSARFDFSPYYGRVDLFFIDGAHSYEYVKSDTLNALLCCHPGSVIAWHDFGRAGVNGVSRWLNELARTCDVYSVPGGSLAFLVVPDTAGPASASRR